MRQEDDDHKMTSEESADTIVPHIINCLGSCFYLFTQQTEKDMKKLISIIIISLGFLPLMAQNDYYIKQAQSYQRETEYYTRQALGFERKVDYFNRQAQGYLREAEYYSKRKN